jgi:voltage-gated potassium channel
VLRAFRLLRFFKLARYSPALHTLIRVLSQEHRALVGAGMLLLAVLLFSSTGMYFIEGHEQPDKFGSVPLSAYWAMTTLTTVGYGDVVPITPLGKLWAMLTMICGLCILALPVAIISTGFAQEVGRRDFVVTWSLMSRIPLLAGLDANEVTEILPMLHAQNISANTEIIGKGSPVTAMYFIASGGVRLTAEGGDMDYRTGDFFGVVAMVGETTAIGRYVSTSRCRVLKLYRDDFLRLEAVNPSLAGQIRQAAEDRHNIRRDLIARLSRDGS